MRKILGQWGWVGWERHRQTRKRPLCRDLRKDRDNRPGQVDGGGLSVKEAGGGGGARARRTDEGYGRRKDRTTSRTWHPGTTPKPLTHWGTQASPALSGPQ